MAADSNSAAADSGGGGVEPKGVPMTNLQRMMGRINGGPADGSGSSKRMRNIIVFCATIGATLIVLIGSFLLASENSYNRRAKVSCQQESTFFHFVQMGVRSAAAKMGLVPDLSECSGRGIWTGTACVCDLGFKGTACQEKVKLDGMQHKKE